MKKLLLILLLIVPFTLLAQIESDTVKVKAILSERGKVWSATVYKVTVTIPQTDKNILGMCGDCDEKKIYYLNERKKLLRKSIIVWNKKEDLQ